MGKFYCRKKSVYSKQWALKRPFYECLFTITVYKLIFAILRTWYDRSTIVMTSIALSPTGSGGKEEKDAGALPTLRGPYSPTREFSASSLLQLEGEVQGRVGIWSMLTVASYYV